MNRRKRSSIFFIENATCREYQAANYKLSHLLIETKESYSNKEFDGLVKDLNGNLNRMNMI